MAVTTYIVSALAVAGTVLAQSKGNCPQTDGSGVYTIQNQGDAAALQSCEIFDGTVSIASVAAGNIAINGVQSITGNLSCINSTGLTSISTDQLSSIGQYFHLEEITVLSNLQMDSLLEVNIINFVGLPNLQQLNFAQGVQQAVGVRVVNTQLNTLSGIELNNVAALEVTNNNYLTDFNVNNLQSISSYLTVAANAPGVSIEFPNLVTAANLTFRNVSSLNMPSLANVTGAFGCYSDNFKEFSAANLTLVGNALVFDNCPSLTNISIPLLTTVGGGFQIANNTGLKIINGFEKLKTVGGALDFSGAFTNVSLPMLADVKGGFNMQSTSTLDCSAFDSDHSNRIIKGTYECQGSLANAQSSGSSATSTASGSSSTHKSAASAIDMNMGAASLLGAIAAFFMI